MRKHFYLALSIVLWLIMIVGFSDNWLTDIGQPSNSQPKFLIHAFFAFSWFTILVIQNGFIKKQDFRTHMKVGKVGFLIYIGFLITTLPLYLKEFKPLSIMVFSQLVFGSTLIGLSYYYRKRDLQTHKMNMMFGSFLLVQPAWDRAAGHLFGSQGLEWLLFYLIFFGLFIWYHKKLKWQVATGFLIWAAGLTNIILNMK
ncbi:hypothetical protein OO013_16085 [Mangrovivirga sp. M17]|uniref:Uncharacterized protein n=1 Tax=Mangrovivirga halotolerans TaxID=2993936 RepID=A0ABT3RUE9_9BACT|nr:hypothetical protein [Mangrovivirga halotolerans]MCX2745399.1 hypothetical protein [Mangrovivirga halotolerans]